jgi:GTP-binding protein
VPRAAASQDAFATAAATWIDLPAAPAVGYARWQPGQPRRMLWPLFGADKPPVIGDGARALASTLFRNGARYLGDAASVCSRPAQQSVPPSPPRGVVGTASGAAAAARIAANQPWVEVALIGRSNVGKSTLMNALLGSRDHKFVSVSRRPGSTATIDFYGVGADAVPRLVLVDTPGYGFTTQGKDARGAWAGMLQRYVAQRTPAPLARVVLLIDARTGVMDADAAMMSLLDEWLVPWHAVLTKADTVAEGELELRALNTAARLARHSMPYPVLHAVSGREGGGVAALAETIIAYTKLDRWSPAAGGRPSAAATAAAAAAAAEAAQEAADDSADGRDSRRAAQWR